MTSTAVGVPPESAYLALLRAARDRAFAAGRLELQRMGFNLVQAQQDLARIAATSGSEAVAARAEGLRKEIDQVLSALSARLTDHTQTAVNTTVSDVVAAHARTAAALAARAGRSDMTAGLAARYDRLNVRVLDVLAARRGGTAHTFKTLMNRHLGEAAPALDRLLEAGIARGQSIGSLTKAVATLLAGQRPEAPWSEVARLGGLSSLMYDARRIARTETMNALREANTAGLKASRMVAAAKWQTNSAHKEEDICDEYAAAEHGFGPGFWPLELWPLGPHPHCGCYQGAVKMKPPSEWGVPGRTAVTVPGGGGAPPPTPGMGSVSFADRVTGPGSYGQPPKMRRLRDALRARGVTLGPEEMAVRLAVPPEGWTAFVDDVLFYGPKGQESIQFQVILHDATGAKAANLMRTFDFEGKRVSHDLFAVAREHQASGLGKRLLESQVGLYDELGISTVVTHANIDVGGYAWARYGYVPESTAGWRKLARTVKAKLDKREGFITSADYTWLLDTLASKDPKAIRVLAGHPIGKELLLGTDWVGVLDLSDPLTRQTFEHYVGRGKAGP